MNRRKVLQASKVGKTLEDAVYSVFDVTQREISAYRDRRRALDRQRLKAARVGPRLSGKIVQIVRDKGYGSIDIDADEDVHFTRHVVAGATFDALIEGAPVEVDVVEAEQGYEASRVVPLGG